MWQSSDLTDIRQVKRLGWSDEWENIFSRLCNDLVLLRSQRDFFCRETIRQVHPSHPLKKVKLVVYIFGLMRQNIKASIKSQRQSFWTWKSEKSNEDKKTNYSGRTREQVSVMSTALQQSMTPFLCHTADTIPYEDKTSKTHKLKLSQTTQTAKGYKEFF